MKPSDPIRPGHYKLASGREVIDLIEELGFGFNLGNALKYMSRDKVNRVEDLRKAVFYIEREIQNLEKANAR